MHVNKIIADFIVNSARRLDVMYPNMGFGNKSATHRKDFLLPEHLEFYDFYDKFDRNGMAEGAVEQTVLQTWEDYPVIRETKDEEQTPREKELNEALDKIRFWQKAAETDRRSMVGAYAGLILRIADDKQFNQPMEMMNSGLEALVDVIPAWEGQLRVAEWYDDETDDKYGEPKMFEFNEANVVSSSNKNAGLKRSFMVHPDRVIIWSKDGTVHGRSMLKSGFDDLTAMERIAGAGGEAFRRNATGRPVLETDKDIRIDDLKRGLGVTSDDEIADAMAKQVEDFSEGFDKFLMLQGMKAKTLDAKMDNPEHPFSVALQGFCASWPIPAKVLSGAQTGERASTEDGKVWRKTNNARRVNTCKPAIMDIIERLKSFGIIEPIDWFVHWSDLTESTMAEKIERAEKMTVMNRNQPDDPIFLNEEIREVIDMGPVEIEIEVDDQTEIDDEAEGDEDDQ